MKAPRHSGDTAGKIVFCLLMIPLGLVFIGLCWFASLWCAHQDEGEADEYYDPHSHECTHWTRYEESK